MRNGCVFKETKMAATKEIKEERFRCDKQDKVENPVRCQANFKAMMEYNNSGSMQTT